MKFVVIFASALLVAGVNSANFVVGNVFKDVILAKDVKVEYNAIPFIKRVKSLFYSGPEKIHGIQALDIDHTKASVNITAGGVGYTYVNLRFKSERGYGLNYDVGIYTKPETYT